MRKFITCVLCTVAMCCCATEYGIDVSHYNIVDWQSVKENNITFCYIKATEGTSFKDKKCMTHVYNAQKAGLKIGLYHYYRTDMDVKQQLANFKSVYSNVNLDLIPVIDVESKGNTFTTETNKHLKELVKAFENEFGVKPMIYYGSISALQTMIDVLDCKFWLRSLKWHRLIPSTVKQIGLISIGNEQLDYNVCPNIKSIMLN